MGVKVLVAFDIKELFLLVHDRQVLHTKSDNTKRVHVATVYM